jgi:soluble lytic murein transglycosylase-like protein
MKAVVLTLGAALVFGVVLFGKRAAAAVKGAVGSSAGFTAGLEKAAAKLSGEVMAAAKKWAAKRDLPLSDVLATILLESRGEPKAHAKTKNEDSYGLMQVNANAWKPTLSSLGYKPEDLFDPDKGVEVGTLILKKYRDTVKGLVDGSKVAQAHSLDTITRLYYAGPKYVQDTLKKAKTTEDTKHFFKNSETYVDHWRAAKDVVAKRWGLIA